MMYPTSLACSHDLHAYVPTYLRALRTHGLCMPTYFAYLCVLHVYLPCVSTYLVCLHALRAHVPCVGYVSY